MPKLFEWLANLSSWYQAIVFALYFGVGLGVFMGLSLGEPGAAVTGAVLGAVLGLVYWYRERRDARSWLHPVPDEEQPEESEGALRFPQRLRRYAKLWLITSPVLILAGVGLSWLVLGTGIYGGLVVVSLILLTSWALDYLEGRATHSEGRRQ